ncbi:MAG: GNAT family N-acetyltransferase [Desulfovermiculus sp.]|nr:GNAT family N-acetyltransferase [Desulfovermiculus sp.]
MSINQLVVLMTDMRGRVSEEYDLAWQSSMREFRKTDWDALARDLPTPLLSWDWLRLLEESGSASSATGWHPQHLAVYRSGRLVAAAPLFIKTHSEGEFVFDQFWAQLASRMDVAYYPKLVGMSPFTPIGAYRFILDSGPDQSSLIHLICKEIKAFCTSNRISGCHFQFVDPDWSGELVDVGFVPWVHPGFAWENQGYVSFDDFLASLKSSRRKNIKKERKSLAEQEIRVEAFSGDEILEKHLMWMYRFYVHTNQRYFPWSCKYLTQNFFLGMTKDLKEHLLLLAAFRPGQDRPVGMSMLVFKDGLLLGRYWGGEEGISFLHFNLCYYEPIDWAIRNRMQRFDPGMGGEHKLYRGFQLVPNYSLHKVFDLRFQNVMRLSLQEHNMLQKRRMQELNQGRPPFGA